MKTMKRAPLLLVTGVLVLSMSFDALADFVQYPVDNGLALFNYSQGLAFSDDFTLLAGTGVSDVTWWGGYADNLAPVSSDFTINFYDSSGGQPGALLASYNAAGVTRTLTALHGNDLTATPESIYQYSFQLPVDLALSTGVTYFLSIEDTTGAVSSWLAGTGNAHSYYASDQNAVSWVGQNRDFAFDLTAAPVPEPISMVMLGGLGAGMLAARRLKRKASREISDSSTS